MNIEEAFKKYENYLKSLPNVTSVGIGVVEGKEVLIVFVRQKEGDTLLHLTEEIPQSLDNVQIVIREEVRVGF